MRHTPFYFKGEQWGDGGQGTRCGIGREWVQAGKASYGTWFLTRASLGEAAYFVGLASLGEQGKGATGNFSLGPRWGKEETQHVKFKFIFYRKPLFKSAKRRDF